MKRLLSLVTALTLVVIVAPRATAQGGGGGRPGMGQMMMKDITLTDAQKAKLDSVVAPYREQMRAMGGTGGPPDSATMAKRRDLMTKQQVAVRAILTADQQKVFDKNVAEMNAMRRP
jgi:Spy/CpxP family protein refolding chaperone